MYEQQFTAYLAKGFKELLQKLSDKEGRSKSWIVQQALYEMAKRRGLLEVGDDAAPPK